LAPRSVITNVSVKTRFFLSTKLPSLKFSNFCSFDGDPDKLAQYILALSKKFDNDAGSKQRFIDDLKVFLEANTEAFVDKLFHALVNKTYEQGIAAATASSSGAAVETKSTPDTRLTDEHSNRRKVCPKIYQNLNKNLMNQDICVFFVKHLDLDSNLYNIFRIITIAGLRSVKKVNISNRLF
jgi:hypothetical protein